MAFTRGSPLAGDLVLVLSSLVDHRNETRWAGLQRSRGARVGFVGLAASKLPDLFLPHADFVVYGEPEEAVVRLAAGERLEGSCPSRDADPESLPFPRWDLVGASRSPRLPVAATRSCSEFCDACPNRLWSRPRHRSPGHVAEELERVGRLHGATAALLRDRNVTRDRRRLLALVREAGRRRLPLRLECEARLEDLDEDLLRELRSAGVHTLHFQVDVGTLAGGSAARRTVAACRQLGLQTVARYVLGYPEETWDSIAGRIEEAIATGPTLAQFKLLTPYPGTPLWSRLAPRIVEKDWERFDGFTPTFRHPSLSEAELRFLLAAAYARFYLRPTFLAGLGRVEAAWTRGLLGRLDARVAALHARKELAAMRRAVLA